MSSILHPYIVHSVRSPIIHTFYEKRSIRELPQPVVIQPTPKPPRRLRIPFTSFGKKIPPPLPSPVANLNIHIDDAKWKRLLYFQQQAIGDLDSCPWIGQHREIVFIAWQILNAVYALHNENIVHADIKPSNILFYHNESHPEVRLTDFSLSVINNGKNKGMIGSPYYAAPEALADDYWNEKIDVWSIGCTLYYLYYGVTLFPVQETDIQDEAERRRARRIRELKAIVDWSHTSIYLSRVMDVTQFNSVEGCRLFEKNSFNDLLRSMFCIEPERRSSVRDLLNSDIFVMQPKIVQYKVIDINYEQLEDVYVNHIKSLCYTSQKNLDEILFRTSVKLCSRVWELIAVITPEQLIVSAVSISYTLINQCVLMDLGSNDENEDLILNYSGMRLLAVLNER